MIRRLKGLGPLFAVLGTVGTLLVAANLLVDIKVETPHLDAVYMDGGVAVTERPWDKVVTGPGHEAHLKGLEKVPCKDCHQIEADKFDKPPPERCLGCHEPQRHLLHDPVVEGAPLCLDCHSFLEPKGKPQPGPWECMRCHDVEQGEKGAVTVHAKEECAKCHKPHPSDGSPATVPADCTECHDKFIARHGAIARYGANEANVQLCLDCHVPHQAVAKTPAKCGTCHQNAELPPDGPNATAPQIATSAVREGGHEACAGCHKAHNFEKTDVVACRTCHDAVHVLGETKAREHQDCRSCHDPHDARGSARGACAKCHTTVRATHPDARGAGLCAGCHPPHQLTGGGPGTKRAVACSACHKEAATDAAWHSPKSQCRDCHKPHEFKLKAPGVCRDCHRANADRVATNPGHRDCAKCHAPHHPMASLPECVQCHKEKRVADRHEGCKSCHDPHTSAKEILPMCVGCHEEQAQGPHSIANVTCNRCHQPHKGPPLRDTPECATCHKNKKTGLHIGLEGGCGRCHKPHGPGSLQKPVCTKCHERAKLPALHQEPKHADCKDCHGGHTAPQEDRVSCTRCHEEHKLHIPEARLCTGCHVFGVGQ